jgi:Beta-carotene isomerase D27-like, C-terminal
MGLPLTMEPNYDTFECQFSFGKTPTDETEALAKSTPCLTRCPAVGSLRRLHDTARGQQKVPSQQQEQESTIAAAMSNSKVSGPAADAVAAVPLDLRPLALPSPPCKMMGD